MLINRKLRELGYMFATRVDPEYLVAMKNLGLNPIVMFNDPKRSGWDIVSI